MCKLGLKNCLRLLLSFNKPILSLPARNVFDRVHNNACKRGRGGVTVTSDNEDDDHDQEL